MGRLTRNHGFGLLHCWNLCGVGLSGCYFDLVFLGVLLLILSLVQSDKILAHAVLTVRATVSSKSWVCFAQRLLCNRPAAEIAAELKIEPNAVYVNGCRFAPI